MDQQDSPHTEWWGLHEGTCGMLADTRCANDCTHTTAWLYPHRVHGSLSNLETILSTYLQLVCPCRCPIKWDWSLANCAGRWSPLLRWVKQCNLWFYCWNPIFKSPVSNPRPHELCLKKSWSPTSPSKPPSMELLSESKAIYFRLGDRDRLAKAEANMTPNHCWLVRCSQDSNIFAVVSYLLVSESGTPESSRNQWFLGTPISRSTQILMGFSPYYPQSPTNYDTSYSRSDTRHLRDFGHILGYFDPQFAAPKKSAAHAADFSGGFFLKQIQAVVLAAALGRCANRRGNRRNTWIILEFASA